MVNGLLFATFETPDVASSHLCRLIDNSRVKNVQLDMLKVIFIRIVHNNKLRTLSMTMEQYNKALICTKG